jgi:hypothetical protein
VALQIGNICSQPTDKAILSALENIPKNLPQTFNRILQKSQTSEEYASYSLYSVVLFRVIAAARRPLTLDELCEAVSVEKGETAWDPNQLVNDMHKLVSSCGSLLVVDEENFTVRFIHQSVRQFLCSNLVDECVKEYSMTLASANLDLGMICVTYLNSDRHISQLVKQKPQLIVSSTTLRKVIPSSNLAGKIALGLLNSKKDVEHSMRPSLEAAGALSSSLSSSDESYNLFLPYAQENWLYHTAQLCRTTHPRFWHLWKRLATGEVKTVELPWSPDDCVSFGQAFIDVVLKTHQWNLVFIYIGRAKASALRNWKSVHKILSIRAGEQLYSIAKSEDIRRLEQILELGLDIKRWDLFDSGGSPTLHVAAFSDFPVYVQWFLDNGVDVNLRGGGFVTALHAASWDGHEAVVKLLLRNGAAVNLQGGHFGTALQVACTQGHVLIVSILLENGADVNLQGGYYGTALQAACSGDYEAIVKILLKNGAEVNHQRGKYGTALVTACTRGSVSIVKLLLENGADVNLQADADGTALEAAERIYRHDIVELLLEHGAIKKRFRVF